MRREGKAAPLVVSRTREGVPGSAALHNKRENFPGKQNREIRADLACLNEDMVELREQTA